MHVIERTSIHYGDIQHEARQDFLWCVLTLLRLLPHLKQHAAYNLVDGKYPDTFVSYNAFKCYKSDHGRDILFRHVATPREALAAQVATLFDELRDIGKERADAWGDVTRHTAAKKKRLWREEDREIHHLVRDLERQIDADATGAFRRRLLTDYVKLTGMGE